MGKFSRTLGKAFLMAKKHAPEGFLLGGLVSIGYGAYKLCKGTLKASEVVSESKEKLDSIESYYQAVKDDKDSDYTEEKYKKDVGAVKKEMALSVAKEYAPGAGFMLTGVGCVLYSHRIMGKRQLAVIAAYKTMDEAFRAYRKRFASKYGEEAERDIYNGKIETDYTVKTVDDEGNETDVVTHVSVPDAASQMYDRYFGDTNPFWVNDCHSNVHTLLNIQDSLQHDLTMWGSLDLNYQYVKTGFKRNKSYGMIVGTTSDGDGDHYIDFGLRNLDGTLSKEALDYIHSGDPHRPLRIRFNVDGIIYDDKKEKENK